MGRKPLIELLFVFQSEFLSIRKVLISGKFSLKLELILKETHDIYLPSSLKHFHIKLQYINVQ